MTLTSAAIHGHSTRAVGSILDLAARSIAAAAGSSETVADVLHGRALRHYEEGLTQYLAIRLGGAAAAARALAEVRARVARLPHEALLGDPGVRARLYRIARDVIADADVAHESDARRKLPWRAARRSAVLSDDELAALRLSLPPADAELLELRHARELGPDELAYVLGLEVEQVLERLEIASELARALLPGDRRVNLRRALLEAFALERLSDSKGPDEREPLPDGFVVGQRYAIERLVGRGAFGDVYRAKDTEVPGHVVALKILHQPATGDEAKTSALRELHLIASVFHPSVVQFKDHGWHEHRLWFVMPWYQGETLEARMRREPLSRAEARRIFERLASALATMHAAGIRHQDVKPDNIFLARIEGFTGGEEEVLPVLLDLGVAAKEAEMVVAGTPTYFAPEVAAQFSRRRHRPKVTPKADVFALALSLRNALDPASQPDVPAGAVEAFIHERARVAPSTPRTRDLRFLTPHLERWLCVDADERPTAQELAVELAVLTAPEERRARRRATLKWLLPLIVTLGVVFTSAVYYMQQRTEIQRLEAERARTTAAGLREDLEESRRHQRALEGDVAQIRSSYEQSRMTRQQLAERIARVEAELTLTRSALDDAAATEGRLRDVLSDKRGELEEAAQTATALRRELATHRADLDTTRASLEAARGDLSRMDAELGRERRGAEVARARSAELEGQIAASAAQLAAEQAKSERLEREVHEASQARSRAESDLAEVRARLSDLRQQLAGLTAQAREPRPTTEAPREPPSPPATDAP